MKHLFIYLEIDFAQYGIQVIQFLLPALIVFGITYTLIKKFLEVDYRNKLLDIKKESQPHVLPARLQAYERLIIFLERISPDNLVLRQAKAGESAANFRLRLIQSINEEFNHNIAQQLYVSNQAWTLIKAVKEQIIGIIENAYKDMNESSKGPDLGTQIMKDMMQRKENVCQIAIEFLKKEIEIQL